LGLGTGHWITPFLYDDKNEHIYIGYKEIQRYADGSWEQLTDFELDGEVGNHYRLVQSRENRNHLLSIVHPTWSNIQQKDLPGVVRLSDDGGKDWRDISDRIPIDEAPYASDATYGNTGNDVFISFGGQNSIHKVYRSEDNGMTWLNYTKDLPAFPINCIAHHYGSALNNIYVGTDYGVFFTNDMMDNWEVFCDELPVVEINDLDINIVTNKLTAATFGRGIWETELAETELIQTSLDEQNTTKSHRDIIVNQNQNGRLLTLEYGPNVIANSVLNVSIRAIDGRVVHQQRIVAPNENQIHLGQNLLPGKYFMIIGKENQFVTHGFLVMPE